MPQQVQWITSEDFADLLEQKAKISVTDYIHRQLAGSSADAAPPDTTTAAPLSTTSTNFGMSNNNDDDGENRGSTLVVFYADRPLTAVDDSQVSDSQLSQQLSSSCSKQQQQVKGQKSTTTASSLGGNSADATAVHILSRKMALADVYQDVLVLSDGFPSFGAAYPSLCESCDADGASGGACASRPASSRLSVATAGVGVGGCGFGCGSGYGYGYGYGYGCGGDERAAAASGPSSAAANVNINGAGGGRAGLKCVSQPCMPSQCGPTKILPFVYLGSHQDAMNAEVLKRHGINYIVNLSVNCPKPDWFCNENFLRIPVNDTNSEKLLPHFESAFNFLDKVRKNKGIVLIHCMAGISRSPTLAIAYVMSHLRMSHIEAYKFVKNKRPTIAPNFNFIGQLLQFEKVLSAKVRGAACKRSPSFQELSASSKCCGGGGGDGTTGCSPTPFTNTTLLTKNTTKTNTTIVVPSQLGPNVDLLRQKQDSQDRAAFYTRSVSSDDAERNGNGKKSQRRRLLGQHPRRHMSFLHVDDGDEKNHRMVVVADDNDNDKDKDHCEDDWPPLQEIINQSQSRQNSPTTATAALGKAGVKRFKTGLYGNSQQHVHQLLTQMQHNQHLLSPQSPLSYTAPVKLHGAGAGTDHPMMMPPLGEEQVSPPGDGERSAISGSRFTPCASMANLSVSSSPSPFQQQQPFPPPSASLDNEFFTARLTPDPSGKRHHPSRPFPFVILPVAATVNPDPHPNPHPHKRSSATALTVSPPSSGGGGFRTPPDYDDDYPQQPGRNSCGSVLIGSGSRSGCGFGSGSENGGGVGGSAGVLGNCALFGTGIASATGTAAAYGFGGGPPVFGFGSGSCGSGPVRMMGAENEFFAAAATLFCSASQPDLMIGAKRRPTVAVVDAVPVVDSVADAKRAATVRAFSVAAAMNYERSNKIDVDSTMTTLMMNDGEREQELLYEEVCKQLQNNDKISNNSRGDENDRFVASSLQIVVT